MNIHTTRHACLKALKQLQASCSSIMPVIGMLTIVSISHLGLVGCDDTQVNTSSVQDETQSNQRPYCQNITTPFPYSLCQVPQDILLEANHQLSLQLFWRVGNDNTNKQVKPLYTFNALNQDLINNPQKMTALTDKDGQPELVFATNAGMYNQNFAPIGYTVIDGKQVLSLNLNEGAGNFHLMPNGVFWWDKHGFYITESHTMAEILNSGTQPIYATQSGPMLVINGDIHPKFRETSISKKLRNAVGICEDGNIKLVNTNSVVNFYELATLFKDDLNCDNALFLDGGIASALYAPDIKRNDNKNMGVMIGLIKSNDAKHALK